MSFHKWMPAGQDPAQVLLNTDKLSCSWGLHTALWRLLHPLTYNNKEQRAVFAANELYIRLAAAALSLPNSGQDSAAAAGGASYVSVHLVLTAASVRVLLGACLCASVCVCVRGCGRVLVSPHSPPFCGLQMRR